MNSNPLFDMSPYQSKASTSYTTDWKDATYLQPQEGPHYSDERQESRKGV